MARIRTIKPEFPQSESVGKLSRDARLLFIMLWTIADDAGRLRAANPLLAGQLYPYDADAGDLLEDWVVELIEAGCIARYRVADTTYISIVNWLQHQKIDRPSVSRLPPQPAPVGAARELAMPREASLPDLGSRTKDRGPRTDVGGGGSRATAINPSAELKLIAPVLFKQFRNAYPGQVSERGAAREAFFAAVENGGDADLMIASASGASPDVPAEEWLLKKGWKRAELSIKSESACHAKHTSISGSFISPEATALANEMAKLAGQDPAFPEPSWCGAAYTVQRWITNGWHPDLIRGSITEQIASANQRGNKIECIDYFERGIARFIQKQSRPLPQIVELPAQTVEVSIEATRLKRPANSGYAAIDRVYDAIEQQMQCGGGEEVSEARVRRLPS